jgi:hypothetical protein
VFENAGEDDDNAGVNVRADTDAPSQLRFPRSPSPSPSPGNSPGGSPSDSPGHPHEPGGAKP